MILHDENDLWLKNKVITASKTVLFTAMRAEIESDFANFTYPIKINCAIFHCGVTSDM